jgi:hypothetical protein
MPSTTPAISAINANDLLPSGAMFLWAKRCTLILLLIPAGVKHFSFSNEFVINRNTNVSQHIRHVFLSGIHAPQRRFPNLIKFRWAKRIICYINHERWQAEFSQGFAHFHDESFSQWALTD